MLGSMTNRLRSILRAYTSLFLVLSFFTERTMAVADVLAARAVTTLLFEAPNSLLTTCTPFNISWQFVGVPHPILLTITNNSAVLAAAPTSVSATHFTDATNVARAIPTGVNNPTPIVTVNVAENIQPNIEYYVWSSVNVSQGWYAFEATMPSIGYSAVSEQVYVAYGPDTSCLSSSPTSSTTMAQTTTSQSTSVSTSSSTSSSSSTTSTSALPVGSASKTSSKHIGAIVGGILGAVVFLVIAVAAWFLLYRKRRTTITKSSAAQGPRRWNGLSSVDSRGGLMGDTGRHNPHTASIGTLPFSPSDEAVAAVEKASIHSRPGDASPFGDVHAASGRPSVADSLESTGYPPSSPARTSTMGGFVPMSRTHSLATSATHYMGGAGPGSAASHAPLVERGPPSPTSPADERRHANRRSLGAARRKPVPAYAGEDDTCTSVPASLAPSPVPPPSPSPGPEYTPHYMTRSQSGHDGSQHELAHKSSFGPAGVEGRALHYLMPDPPMAPRG